MRLLLRAAARAWPCAKTPFFELVCSALARMLPDDGALCRTNFGIAPYLACDLPIAKSNYVFGRPENNLSERATCELTKILVAECRTFVDVGANEGLFTFMVHATRPGDIDLHCFEPDKRLCARLERNLLANGIKSFSNNVAVSSQSGLAAFFRNLDDDLSGSLTGHFAHKHRTEAIKVRTVSLGDYFRMHGINRALVKIDVEGAGVMVWDGARDAVAGIEYLVIEMLKPEITAGLPSNIMRDTGWHGYYIRDFDLVNSVEGEFAYVAPFWNWLFCNLSPAALSNKLNGTKFRVVMAEGT